jgi:hypothetical protein
MENKDKTKKRLKELRDYFKTAELPEGSFLLSQGHVCINADAFVKVQLNYIDEVIDYPLLNEPPFLRLETLKQLIITDKIEYVDNVDAVRPNIIRTKKVKTKKK